MQLLTADTSVPLTQSRIIMFKIPRTNVDITLRQDRNINKIPSVTTRKNSYNLQFAPGPIQSVLRRRSYFASLRCGKTGTLLNCDVEDCLGNDPIAAYPDR